MRRLQVSLIIVVLVFAATVSAQQTPAPARLTWVRYYQVQPGKGDDFVRLIRDSSQALFDRLVTEKKIAGWGIVVPMTRTEEPWTHAVYITLQDWTAVESLVNAIESNEAQRAPADMKRLGDLMMGSIRQDGIRDVILRHLVQSTAPPSAKPKYIGTDTYVVKQGRGGDAVELFNEWAKPLFTDVAARGKLGPWGLSTQDNITGQWTHMVWFFMSDLSAQDDLESTSAGMGAMKLRGFDVRLRDLSEPEKHRSQILRIIQSTP
jgi:hypothetical protein